MDETVDLATQPVVWISSWVDYSDKYGFSYKLCDNSIGVMFLDHSKLILMSNGINIQYKNQDGSKKDFSIGQFHEGPEKKMKLFTLFQQFLGTVAKTGTSMSVQETGCAATGCAMTELLSSCS